MRAGVVADVCGAAGSWAGDWHVGMRRGSSAGGVCGYRQGSVGRGVSRRHRRGQRSGRHAALRRRQNRWLPQVAGACRPRSAHVRAAGVRAASAVRRDREGVGGDGAGRRGDDPALGRVRAPRRPARVPGGLRGVGGPRSRAAELEAGGPVRTPSWAASRRAAAVAASGSRAVPPDPALPVAVEAELSVKGARRLESICRA